MPVAKKYNMAGVQVGEVELSEAVFGVEPNGSVLHESVKNHLANRRQGTQSALTKGEVSYSTKKPWRQKGTGRARAGYKGSPVWTHGGVAFAPKPRSYSYSLNRKVRRLALVSALSAKAAEGSVIVVDDLNMDTIKTKDFARFLKAVGSEGKALVVAPEVRENVVKSARNIPGVKTTIARKFEDENGKEQRSVVLSAYDVLNCEKFIIDAKALQVVEEVYA
ncbi:MAG: 50S ribosomal protein L4 [Oscillospiraceae bacterium]|nr:50S ribosomal protein L4 [Oscillospiraceae bacterium]